MRLIDADQMVVDESEAYMSVQEQIKHDDLKWLVNFAAHCKIQRLIADTPTVDAVPVAHGRWVEKEKYTFGIMYDCSLCGNRILDNGHTWNYCPNCGAKMAGERKD